MILIFAESDDVHARMVCSRLRRDLGMDATILDTADYPVKWSADLLAGGTHEYRIKTPENTISSYEVTGVWRRRIKPCSIRDEITDREIRGFCRMEAMAFIVGLLGGLTNIVNSASSEHLASRKAFQLQAAVDAGLRVPETLISSDPKEIRNFYDQNSGEVVFKLLTPTRFQFSETRALRSDDLAFLGSAIFAPTIYQRKISPKCHLRVTIVDGETFCATITPSRDYAMLDWRLDPDPIIKEGDMPTSVTAGLLQLMRLLGLRYGAVDMILGNDDVYYFLEVNPGGQFLFVEIETEQPISLAVARALGSSQS
jgi:hypothetical protein